MEKLHPITNKYESGRECWNCGIFYARIKVNCPDCKASFQEPVDPDEIIIERDGLESSRPTRRRPTRQFNQFGQRDEVSNIIQQIGNTNMPNIINSSSEELPF